MQPGAWRFYSVIAISSFKPFGKSAEHDANTLRARESWWTAFTEVVYFNAPESRLECPSTVFVQVEDYPRIIDMVGLAGCQTDWVAIINSDIVVGEQFAKVQTALNRKHATACSSNRYEFEGSIETGRVVDAGLDFFAALPAVWRRCYSVIPEDLRIGCQSWDTWMLSFLTTFALGGFWDITPCKVIFHPKHGSRAYGPCVNHSDLKMFSTPAMPAAQLRI